MDYCVAVANGVVATVVSLSQWRRRNSGIVVTLQWRRKVFTETLTDYHHDCNDDDIEHSQCLCCQVLLQSGHILTILALWSPRQLYNRLDRVYVL